MLVLNTKNGGQQWVGSGLMERGMLDIKGGIIWDAGRRILDPVFQHISNSLLLKNKIFWNALKILTYLRNSLLVPTGQTADGIINIMKGGEGLTVSDDKAYKIEDY